jgi:hypothetical protein
VISSECSGILNQRDLLFGERSNFLPRQEDRADELGVAGANGFLTIRLEFAR